MGINATVSIEELMGLRIEPMIIGAIRRRSKPPSPPGVVRVRLSESRLRHLVEQGHGLRPYALDSCEITGGGGAVPGAAEQGGTPRPGRFPLPAPVPGPPVAWAADSPNTPSSAATVSRPRSAVRQPWTTCARRTATG
ncbi:hypothetical protein GCM10027074_76800 [Streptomyces deserti]